jgi:nitrous oxidase accessory protein NosD
MLRYLTLKTFGVDAVATLRQVEGDISRHIIEFEKRFHVCRYKVGVLYVKDGQCTENDFYSNNSTMITTTTTSTFTFTLLQ